jgi:uncharacterized protein with GYD domain
LEDKVAKYLIQFNYTGEGLKGLMKEGGSSRKEVVEKLAKSLGGTIEAFYFCFGEYDGIAIVDGTEPVNQVAGNLILNASGAVKTKTTVLITPEEVDQAVKMTGEYRPPGK